MTVRHALGLAAWHLENGCLAVVARLGTWRARHVPETLDAAPDLWPAIQARIAPAPPSAEIVGFCCGQAFTTYEQHQAHAAGCRYMVWIPAPGRRDPRREAQA